jgi:PhnB protein
VAGSPQVGPPLFDPELTKMTVKATPDGYHAITPYLFVEGVPRLIDFLVRVFDAVEVRRLLGPDGAIGHAEYRIGDSLIMLCEARGEWKPMPASLYVYVSDTDDVYNRAIGAGSTSLMEPADQFYGDRNAGMKDPAGNLWWIATHLEDLTPEEFSSRSEAHAKKASGG